MIVNPIIPIWLMSIICVFLLVLKRKGIFPYIRQMILILLLFVINLRIMVPDGEVTVKTQKMSTKVLFVVDSTISMVAKDDGEHERLEKVREDCSYILTELDGAKFAVISFNNEAHYLSPFTNNSEYAQGVIDAIYPMSSLYAKGSSMNVWKEMTIDILKTAKEDATGDVVLFFISDGEITNNEKLESFSELSQYVDGGAVLGYGTSQGGQMEMTSFYSDEPEVIEDRSSYPYKPAVSKIDESNLRQIAKDVGVDYIHMTKASDLDGVLANIKENASTEDTDKSIEGHKDIYYVFVIPLLLLLLFEIYDTRKRV